MDCKLDKLLSKIHLSQDQYVELWCAGEKCRDIISKYFEDGAREIFRDKCHDIELNTCNCISLSAFPFIIALGFCVCIFFDGDMLIKSKDTLVEGILKITAGSILLFAILACCFGLLFYRIRRNMRETKMYREAI